MLGGSTKENKVCDKLTDLDAREFATFIDVLRAGSLRLNEEGCISPREGCVSSSDESSLFAYAGALSNSSSEIMMKSRFCAVGGRKVVPAGAIRLATRLMRCIVGGGGRERGDEAGTSIIDFGDDKAASWGFEVGRSTICVGCVK